jgi:hypothetical protein
MASCEKGNILHHTVHCFAEELLVFVTHRDTDQKFGLAWRVKVHLAKGEFTLFESVGIAGDGGVSHMRKLTRIAIGTIGQ